MFKYVRNLNGTSTPPEPIEISVGQYANISEGAVGRFVEDCISFEAFYEENTDTFVSIEEKRGGDGKTKIKLIRALPGMLFEVPLINTSSIPPVGSKITVIQGPDGCLSCVCLDAQSNVEVINTDEFEYTGKILVMFV